MNPVIILVRNNRVLTKEAVDSVMGQSIPIELLAINNGSDDGSAEYLNSLAKDHRNIVTVHFNPGKGVAESWNFGLRYWFDTTGCEYCLVINNDVILRPDTYEHLIAQGGEFVTAVGVRGKYFGEVRRGLKKFRDDKGKEIFPGGEIRPPYPTRRHPDFSNFLIRRSVWNTVGEFDENFVGAYAEDSDYHVRMHKAGIDAVSIDMPFYHYGAATMTNSLPQVQAEIGERANRNREYFKQKWGVEVGSDEYYQIFGNEKPEETVFVKEIK